MPAFILMALAKAKNLPKWARENPQSAKVAALVSALVLLAALGIAATLYIARLHDRIGELSLAANNAEAERDTTRSVLLSKKDSIRLLGDSLALVQRLAVQRTQERDDLDKALKQTRTARLALEAKVDSLSVRHVASRDTVKTDSIGERSASFHIRQEPFTADARVSLPAVGRGALDLSVVLDSASLRARLGCGDAKDGIRPALVSLETPKWLHATVTSAEQDPAMCNPKLGEHPGVSRWRPSLSVGPAYNLMHLADGSWRSGWGISGQLSIFHWP